MIGIIPFAPKGDNCPVIPILIRLLLNLCRERNRTHDAIPKLLIQHRLIGIAIILDNLIQAINKWFLRRHFNRATSIREATQLVLQDRGRNIQQCGELLDILRRSLGLTVEDGGGGYFITADMVGNLFKAKLFGSLCLKEGFGGLGEVRMLGCLDWKREYLGKLPVDGPKGVEW